MHRCRQTPQRKSLWPNRSMCTSMHSSVSSTFVTVWAFKRNCFLINVSMSTSGRLLSYFLGRIHESKPIRGAFSTPVNLQLKVAKGLQPTLHFSDRSPVAVLKVDAPASQALRLLRPRPHP